MDFYISTSSTPYPATMPAPTRDFHLPSVHTAKLYCLTHSLFSFQSTRLQFFFRSMLFYF